MKNILIIAAALFIYLKFSSEKSNFNLNAPPPEVKLDSIKKVLKLISDEVYISVKLYNRYEYDIPKNVPVLGHLWTTTYKNYCELQYNFTFFLGFDLTGNMDLYYKNGEYNIKLLQERIKLIDYKYQRKTLKNEGAFPSSQLDSLDARAQVLALDSLNTYFFEVKEINGKPVIKH